jgi:hypothetical protein
MSKGTAKQEKTDLNPLYKRIEAIKGLCECDRMVTTYLLGKDPFGQVKRDRHATNTIL